MKLTDKIKSWFKAKPNPKWCNDLIMCPSQCYLNLGNNLTLYMRWRWGDPWTFSVIKDLYKSTEQWYDIDYPFKAFSHDQYPMAQIWIEKWWKANKKKVIKFCTEHPK